MEYDKVTYYRIEDRESVLRKLESFLSRNDRIKIGCVFGSFVRGESVRDLDVAVYAVPPFTFEELLEYGSQMEVELGMPVDLVQFQDLAPVLRYKVLGKGIAVIPGRNELHQKLIAQAFSESRDLVIGKLLLRSRAFRTN